MSTPALPGEALRQTLRRVASPVTIVTVFADGAPRGATIGSFTSVSLEPPLVSFNVKRDSQLHEALAAADAFAVHLLAASQADLSTHFALPDRTSAEQFDRLPHRPGSPSGPPVLEGTLGVLHCRLHARFDAGDHALVLGEVLHIESGTDEAPLLYYARSYRTVGEAV